MWQQSKWINILSNSRQERRWEHCMCVINVYKMACNIKSEALLILTSWYVFVCLWNLCILTDNQKWHLQLNMRGIYWLYLLICLLRNSFVDFGLQYTSPYSLLCSSACIKSHWELWFELSRVSKTSVLWCIQHHKDVVVGAMLKEYHLIW